jgi:hypothetical protein
MGSVKPNWEIRPRDSKPQLSSFFEVMEELVWWRNHFWSEKDLEVCCKQAELIDEFVVKMSELFKSIQ